MYRSRELRFLIGAILTIILLIVLIVVAIGHKSTNLINQKPMASYANNSTAQVSMLIDGPVSAPSQHNQVQEIVSNSQATINIIQGYNDRIINTQNYPFSDAGFHVFLRSLEFAGFNKGTNNPSLSQASGYCPTGDRYIFTFKVNGKQVQRYWTTNCSGLPHTFNGNLSLTTQLFQSLVPNYANLTQNLNI